MTISDSELLYENIYCHLKRLNWIQSKIKKGDQVVELGCGTGFMITFQLLKKGYNVYGFDQDYESIRYGKELFRQEGLAPERLSTEPPAFPGHSVEVIIVSEVLEHLYNPEMTRLLEDARRLLTRDGWLLITVPNGYGWFEWEQFLWHNVGLEGFFDRPFIRRLVNRIKGRVIEAFRFAPYPHPSTLSSSPHVQRFSYGSIQRKLRASGYRVEEITGSALIAGPLSNQIFTGFQLLMRWNARVADHLPRLASGFYLQCHPQP